MARRWRLMVAAALVVVTACSGGADGGVRTDGVDAAPVLVDLSLLGAGTPRDFGDPPDHPSNDWSSETISALTTVVSSIQSETSPSVPLDLLAASGDARLAWALADVLRFAAGTEGGSLVQDTINELTGIDLDGRVDWTATVDHLTAWDLPAPPRYVEFKHSLYTQVDPRWEGLLDPEADIDWRHVAWGGVLIDDRPAGSTDPCRCIPALDDPPVTPADGGDWYPDDRVVFGVVVEGQARAYPRNIMEVHEMVNDTLGGRRIGMPYCTLCGSAQAYFTDELRTTEGREVTDDHPPTVLRTSGLLIRSNKMMYELNTQSFIDTFLGVATSGPLADADVELIPVSVVTTTWGQWKQDHPDTTILASDGGLGRTYRLDPLGGRDDDGPIFPIGSADLRLPVQEPVLGVITGSGQPLAFHVAAATEVLEGGQRIVVEGIELRLDGGGLRAERADGSDAQGHQSFWFAWSQFRPATSLWPHDFQPEGS